MTGVQTCALPIGKPIKYEGDPSGNIYYAEIVFEDGRAIMPTGQSEHRDEVQFRVSIPDAIDGKSTKGAWDASNDWSYEGIEDAPNELKYKSALNEHITMYVDDVLVWGTEPDGTKPDLSQPATKPVTPTTTPATKPSESGDKLIGDANCDGTVDLADATAIIQHIGNEARYALSERGFINADCTDDGKVTGADAMAIQKLEAKQISSLPYTE